jgi:hypothetical protein
MQSVLAQHFCKLCGDSYFSSVNAMAMVGKALGRD